MLRRFCTRSLRSKRKILFASSLTNNVDHPAPMIDTFGPPGYHNPSFDLPAIKYVGVLACQRSPFLEDIITHVVSCEKSVPPPPSADSKKKKKDVAALLVADEYEIQLEDTGMLLPSFPTNGTHADLQFSCKSSSRKAVANPRTRDESI